MVVYEATKPEDFMKMAQFIVKQPKTNPSFLSWNCGHKESTARFLEHCKETRENYFIFWCEDSEGEIRAIQAIEIHDTGKGYSVATRAFGLVKHEDMLNARTPYYMETLNHILVDAWSELRDEKGLFRNCTRGEFWIAEYIINWTKEVFDGCYEIEREAEFQGQKVYFMVVDFLKYLELHKNDSYSN